MPNADDGDSKPVLTCSICGRSQHDISDIAGSPADFVRDFICDECVGSELARLESPTLAFSKDLEQTLHRALTIARERSEPHAIEEHLLLAVIDDPDAAVVMRGCNLDLEAARQRFTASLADRAETPLAEGADTTPSAAFQRIIQRAVIHVQSAKGGGLVTGTDVLVAAFAEPPAAELLQALGFTRYDAISYISHGAAEGDQGRAGHEDAAEKPGSLAEVRLLNDDYTPMEFVVHVLERVFNMDRETATRIMLEIHNEGTGICGIYPYHVADAKVAEVHSLAHEHQHPLQCVLKRSSSI
jgi:ATP-dependent Clp protease adapter protein ClpS